MVELESLRLRGRADHWGPHRTCGVSVGFQKMAFHLLQEPQRTISVPLLQMGKLRPREVGQPVQTASKRQAGV